MSQRPVDDPPNFSIATSHNERQDANKHIKNYIFTVSNFWLRYNRSDRRNKSILAKELLDFIFTNGGRVRDLDQFYDQAYLNAHPTIYGHVLNSLKNYISDQITYHKKKLKVVESKNIHPVPQAMKEEISIDTLIDSSVVEEIGSMKTTCVVDKGYVDSLQVAPHDFIVHPTVVLKHPVSSAETIIAPVEEVGSMKTTCVEDKGYVDSLQVAPHDFIVHSTVVLKHPVFSAETIIAPLKEETSLLLMTRSRKTYERKLPIKEVGSMKTTSVVDKGYVDSLQVAPHDTTVVLKHPVSSAETIIAPLKEETSLLLMTRSRKTYERKHPIKDGPSFLPKANEIIDVETLIMPQLIRKVVDETYIPDHYFPQENRTIMNIISEIIGKYKIFPDFNAENFLNYSFGGIKQICFSRSCMLKLKADSKNPLENYVNNEIIDFHFIVIRR